MASYLFEIGCEEIPASFIQPSANYLKDEFTKRLGAMHLPFTEISVGGTPRRLFINIDGLPLIQEEKVELVMGPPASIAFTENNELTDTAKKFAQSKGIAIDTLKRVTTQKGDYLQGEKKVGGAEVSKLLAEITPEVIKSMPFPKSMKWGDNDFRFVRPIHWFLSIFDGKALEFETDGIKASNKTYGHRFLSPESIEVSNITEYREKLAEKSVIVDSEKRKEIILSQIKELEEATSLHIDTEGDLLDTVIDLVEYPYAIMGSFHESFLELPEEVLITSMKVHQKYFPVRDSSNKLINKFVGIANIKSPHGDDTIRQGYERVLKARLNDGFFFFNNDKKVKLESRAEDLKKVVYQEKLGTSFEKMERFKAISLFLAEKLNLDNKASIEKTAYLCKADLLSEMVYEFPELQGIMGSYYAKFEGIDNNIAEGIKEHYQPKFAGDELPKTVEGKIVSIADKIDTIAGVFAIGMKPTGNLDPYGLRRSAIGILSIIEDAGYRIDLKEVINFALDKLSGRLTFNKEELAGDIMSFINLRYKQMLVSREVVSADVFDAVSPISNDPLKVYSLAKILTQAKGSDDFQLIAASFKRINNILKKNEWIKTDFTDELLESDAEKELASLVRSQNIKELIDNEKNYAALDELMKFAPVVNSFFENVMVMAEDKAVRENRLSLITALRNIFLSIGDLSAISA